MFSSAQPTFLGTSLNSQYAVFSAIPAPNLAWEENHVGRHVLHPASTPQLGGGAFLNPSFHEQSLLGLTLSQELPQRPQ